MGAMASRWKRGSYRSYSSVQKLRMKGSVTWRMTHDRYSLSTNIRLTPRIVVLGHSVRTETALYKIYSRRGPQESRQMPLNAATMPDATSERSSGATLASRLRP